MHHHECRENGPEEDFGWQDKVAGGNSPATSGKNIAHLLLADATRPHLTCVTPLGCDSCNDPHFINKSTGFYGSCGVERAE